MITNGIKTFLLRALTAFSADKMIFVFFVIWITNLCLLPISSATENWLVNGESSYRQGNLDKAQNCFVRLIKDQPGNLVAHYYLGLILMREKHNEQAAGQFQFIISTNANCAEAKFSRQALAHLSLVKPLTSNPFSVSAANPDYDKQSLKEAVCDIQMQTDRAKQIALKEEVQAATILKEADEKAGALEAEAAQRQQAMSKEVYYGWVSASGIDGLYRSLLKAYPLYTADQIATACEGLLLKASEIRNQAAKEVLDIASLAKLKELSVEKSALLVERQLVDQSTASVKMQSKGTNLYVRNYETSSQNTNTNASGQISLLGNAKLLIPPKEK